MTLRRVKKVKEASRKTYDALFWLLADQLASQEGASGVPGVSHPPTPVQQQQLLTCLCQLVTFSQSQMLSQLLLQLLLISCCMPSLEDLRQGTKQSLHFVSSLVRACTEASLEAPGELIFADVQICLVLACVYPLIHHELLCYYLLLYLDRDVQLLGMGGIGSDVCICCLVQL